MKHTHLTLNTAITAISLVIILVLLYWVTVKQDTRYTDILTLIDKQQNTLEMEQRIRQGLEREMYNHLSIQPVATLDTLVIPREAMK